MSDRVADNISIIVHTNGDKYYYKNGLIHRDDDLPAIEFACGNSAWYFEGKRHRENGPAFIRIDGYTAWYKNNKRHRLDGPAVTHSDGTTQWWRWGSMASRC